MLKTLGFSRSVPALTPFRYSAISGAAFSIVHLEKRQSAEEVGSHHRRSVSAGGAPARHAEGSLHGLVRSRDTPQALITCNATHFVQHFIL